MNTVTEELSKKYPQALVLQVEAEEQADIAESFDIEAVPTFLILQVEYKGHVSSTPLISCMDIRAIHCSRG